MDDQFAFLSLKHRDENEGRSTLTRAHACFTYQSTMRCLRDVCDVRTCPPDVRTKTSTLHGTGHRLRHDSSVLSGPTTTSKHALLSLHEVQHEHGSRTCMNCSGSPHSTGSTTTSHSRVALLLHEETYHQHAQRQRTHDGGRVPQVCRNCFNFSTFRSYRNILATFLSKS